MKKILLPILTFVTLIAVSYHASAAIISPQFATFNFGAVADSHTSTLTHGVSGGERGATAFTFNNNGVSVTASGTIYTRPAFAYLDRGDAGLGVCQYLSSDNQCDTPSDDNVTFGETLRLEFDQAVTINSIIFVNGGHRTDFDGRVGLTIDGVSSTESLTNIFGVGLGLTGTVFDFYNPNGNGDYDGSNDQQFYINNLIVIPHGIQTVPVPAAAWLMLSGLLGLAAVARRKA